MARNFRQQRRVLSFCVGILWCCQAGISFVARTWQPIAVSLQGTSHATLARRSSNPDGGNSGSGSTAEATDAEPVDEFDDGEPTEALLGFGFVLAGIVGAASLNYFFGIQPADVGLKGF
mmetsp:Transcript_101755/g.286971  ORF Transcript_101755/g.286971 Transcript_101755/m.286971 type:complete len:119 (+) Transcript_101755:57-413(+)